MKPDLAAIQIAGYGIDVGAPSYIVAKIEDNYVEIHGVQLVIVDDCAYLSGRAGVEIDGRWHWHPVKAMVTTLGWHEDYLPEEERTANFEHATWRFASET